MLHDLRRERLLMLAEGDGTGGSDGTTKGGDPPADQEWFTGLPDTLKPDVAVFEPFKDKPVTEVLGAFRDLSKKAADFAVPATPAEYGIKLPEIPEGVNFDQKGFEAYVAKAHKAGVPAKALQAIIDQEVADTIAASAAEKEATAAADKALRASWGDKYDENMVHVQREIAALPQDMKDFITAVGFGNHPQLFKFMHLVASARGEGKLRAGGDEGAGKKPLSERLYGGTK
ncbi:MAG: hypothetical protein B7Z62_07890 [Deltaproteobacteria bacterium 37-65-8]|nr:MAG: hypothetical protein B7Z62_07890 [Deltaproteobacteria bacterium 37-65-8]HQT97813.1 hypothetical protein [Thermodesulfobacteriota bacterium]